MPERVRLFRDDGQHDDEQQPAGSVDSDPVATGPELGFLHLEVRATEDDDHHRWRAKILGSDYLVWGMNHRQVIIEFASGERRQAVIRATGDLIGLGPMPGIVGQKNLAPRNSACCEEPKFPPPS